MTTAEIQQTSHDDVRIQSKTFPIRLRNVQPGDAPSFVTLLSEDLSCKPMDLETAQGAISRMQESARQPSVLSEDGSFVATGPSRVNLSVVHWDPSSTTKGRMIGLAGYGAIKTWTRDGRQVRAGDAGVVLDPDERGKGYAVEVMKLCLDWGFEKLREGGLQLDLVTITTGSENVAMKTLVEEKLGLKDKGIERNGEFGGKERYWELKPEDWEGSKQRL